LSQVLVSPEQSGLGEWFFQLAGNGFRIVAQENGTEPPLSPGDQDGAQGTTADRVVELGGMPSDGWNAH
jgi:hypothetical protein